MCIEKRKKVIKTHREKEKRLQEFSDRTLKDISQKFEISSMRRGT